MTGAFTAAGPATGESDPLAGLIALAVLFIGAKFLHATRDADAGRREREADERGAAALGAGGEDDGCAFVAGLIIAETEAREEVEHEMRPLELIFAPVFFAVTGAEVDFGALLVPAIGILAVALALAGIVANLGLAYGLMGGDLFSAVIVAVVLTTVVAPILLQVTIPRARQEEAVA